MRTIKTPALVPFCLSAALLLLTGCAQIAGGYRVPDDSDKSRSYSSIAGDIDVGRQGSIRNAKTIAGDIDIRERTRVGSLSSIAGSIRLAEEVRVAGSIKTVAGDVDLAEGCTVAGDISTVAGHVRLDGSEVIGDVTVSRGKLDLVRTRVGGTVHIRKFKRAGSDPDAEPAEVTIGPASTVKEVVAEKNAFVRVRIHRTAKVGTVTGIAPEYFD
ncbi:MAG TPA: polymer-forming cytoskeletal protein [Opitutaceae bacterium]|nr:polymer-forming cytoskeletal protein [Opitutaceae bacterium]